MPRQTTDDARWQAAIADFRRSGLTQPEFCRHRGLPLYTFRKRLYARPAVTAQPHQVGSPVATGGGTVLTSMSQSRGRRCVHDPVPGSSRDRCPSRPGAIDLQNVRFRRLALEEVWWTAARTEVLRIGPGVLQPGFLTGHLVELAPVTSTEASDGRLARVGRIDRSVGRSTCARRCRRTDARKATAGSED
jgi:hypothetical protein